jgi:hypothetical protein
MNQYGRFWDWLVSNSLKIESLINNKQLDIVAELISNELDSINSAFSWEIGMKNGEVELVISAEGNELLGKILEEMFLDCPSIPNWKIYRHKQPKSLSALSTLIASQGYQIKLADIHVQVALNSSSSKVDVVLTSQEFSRIPSDKLYNLVFFVLDGVLGEKMVEEWIGEVNVDVVKRKHSIISLSDLQKFMDELTE